MPETLPLPADVAQRATQLAGACRAVAREIRKLKTQMHEGGVNFPHALDTELVHLEMSVDSIYVILDQPHLVAFVVNAKD